MPDVAAGLDRGPQTAAAVMTTTMTRRDETLLHAPERDTSKSAAGGAVAPQMWKHSF